MAALQPRAGRSRRPLVHQGVALACGTRHEDEALVQGYLAVAGIDEVGRGALCGPVVAAAVVLGVGFDTRGLDDSKRLTPRQRDVLSQRIRGAARAWAVGSAEASEVDRHNVLRATHLAMRRAVAGLGLAPDLLLIDALRVPGLELPQRPIVKGDAVSVSIAAASIVAKVARDATMLELDARFPGYGLARNKGYASSDHREALRRLGPSAIHRRSFHVLDVVQPWLFDPGKGN
jgi:ribonuclease HII